MAEADDIQERVEIVDNPDAGRFEARVGNRVVAISTYKLTGKRAIFLHTETDDAYEGHGIGSTLVREALDTVRGRGLQVVPRCPFVAAWIKRHADYADLVVPGT